MGDPLSPVADVRPHLRGIRLELRCPSCALEFLVEQPSVCGLPLGNASCPGCALSVAIEPHEVATVLESRMHATSHAECVQLTEEASALARSWHRAPLLAELLHLHGAELGPPTERELAVELIWALVRSAP